MIQSLLLQVYGFDGTLCVYFYLCNCVYLPGSSVVSTYVCILIVFFESFFLAFCSVYILFRILPVYLYIHRMTVKGIWCTNNAAFSFHVVSCHGDKVVPTLGLSIVLTKQILTLDVTATMKAAVSALIIRQLRLSSTIS